MATTIPSQSQGLQSSSHWNCINIERSYVGKFLNAYSNDLITTSSTHVLSYPSSRVLDVATGTGLVAFDLFNYLYEHHPSHQVKIDGIDYASIMVESANKKKLQLIEKTQKPTDMEFIIMDGQDLKFPNETFSTIYSNMGILFFPDIAKGFSEMERVLKIGGKAFISTWTKQIPIEIAIDVLEREGKDLSSMEAIFSLSDTQVVESFGKQAGFSQVTCETVSHSFMTSVAEYVEFSLYVIPSSLWKSNEEKEEFKKSLISELNTHSNDQNKINVHAQAHIVTLTK